MRACVSSLLLLVLVLTALVLSSASAAPSLALDRLSAARLSASKQKPLTGAGGLATFDYWAVAATPDFFWVGSFYLPNSTSAGYTSLLQQVDRKTLTPIANITLRDSVFFDHIMLSADYSLVYVNVMELYGREGFTTYTVDAASLSIVRTTMLPSPLSMLLGVDPAKQLLLCASEDGAAAAWVAETSGGIQASLDGGRVGGNIASGGYDTVSGNVFIYDESAGVLFAVNRSNAIVSQVSNTESRGVIIAMDVDVAGQFAHVLWIRANASGYWWYECVQYTLPALQVDQQFTLSTDSFKVAAFQVSASSGRNDYFIVDRNAGLVSELSKGAVTPVHITQPLPPSSSATRVSRRRERGRPATVHRA